MVNNIIYMAAGNSRRFGANKLLHSIDGKPMFSYGLDNLQRLVNENDSCRLYVVTQYEEIAEYAKGFAHVVMSPDSVKGASYTIKAGIHAAELKGYYTFMAADQPYMTYDTIKNFMESMMSSRHITGCVCHNGTRGNPVMFAEELIPELMLLKEDEGGKKILLKHLDDCFEYQALDEKELQDIDIP